MIDNLNSRNLSDGIDVDVIRGDSDDDEHLAVSTLPGAARAALQGMDEGTLKKN